MTRTTITLPAFAANARLAGAVAAWANVNFATRRHFKLRHATMAAGHSCRDFSL